MRLTVDPRDASILLSLPTRAALRPALAWAAGKRDWIETELARLPGPHPIAPGMVFLFGGEQVQLNWDWSLPRSVGLADGIITIGGPADSLAPRLLRFLRREALTMLEQETRMLAARHGISVTRVAVGDPKARWGSCASSGDIRYSWRLILAPADVRRATVAHEVAHRIHMNHGAAFHALVAELHEADPNPARLWLRSHGAALHWFGRDG
ncbi:YgjP-like metallopeptidase domain-containing protein [Sphingomonas sp.]|uniref:M48 family metallopeptidase n=1 Tax=Sphingomonas sp. TaxID=28214 RepID=UPI0025FCB9F3|nr:YgjP-like metallopeptidase domain-containing protein [Sphingomonas sp.]